MKAKKCLKWLVVALVAAAGMVLLGCPHNNLIENEVLGSNTASERGGSSGVQLVITNFVTSTAQTGRSANSWLNPLRTVSPEHIDLTKGTTVDEYIFVASGVGDGGVYGPVIVDVVSGTGVAVLTGLSNGRWDITVEAYSVAKLKAKTPAWTQLQKDAIVADARDDVTGQIEVHKADAVVLKGQASLQLGSSTKQVDITLTSSSEAKFGDVNVAIYFPDAADRNTIFQDTVSQYKVKAKLVDPANFSTIMGGTGASDTTEVTLFDLTGGPHVDTSFGGSYDYKTYTKDGGYRDVQLQAGTGKLLQYRPSADPTQPDRADPYQIPVGKYVLMVTVETPSGDILYAIDPHFYVEGNRTTMGVLEIKDLLGTQPTKPTGFEVYYSTPKLTDLKAGYDATFAWQPDGSDFSAVGYEIEIANITKLYKNGANNSEIDADGTVDNTGHTVFGKDDLWTTNLDGLNMQTLREDYVTSITWNNQTTTAKYPFVSGSLLAGGDNQITLRLESGNVYAARIRATNGTSKNSDWTYFTDFGATVTGPTKFNQAGTAGIFDLVAITYKLEGVNMYTLTGDRSMDMTIVGDTLVTGNQLLQVYEFNPTNIAQPLNYGFTKDNLAVNVDEQVLVVKDDPLNKIVSSWQGWQDETDKTKLFGLVATPPQDAKTDWKYNGFTNLTLVPMGAGGSSLGIKVNTSDTTNVLSLSTVGFGSTPLGTTLQTSTVTVNGLTPYTLSARPGIYKNDAAAPTKLVVVLNANSSSATRPNATTDLYVAIGQTDGAGGLKENLLDKNGDTITVTNLEVKLLQGNTVMKTTGTNFTAASSGANLAYAAFLNADTNGKLGGVKSGQYTLSVEMTTASGYKQSTKIPVVILYQDQTANIQPTALQ